MTNEDQLDLVPADDEADVLLPPPADQRAPAGPWILTNRFNLIEILSSGLIAPRSSYVKHYADLLDKSGEEVTILRDVPDKDLTSRVASEGDNNFPVLLELDPAVSTDSRGSLFTVRCLPLSSVVAVHFPSEDHLRDHDARRYANVRATDSDSRFHVSPTLFDGGVVSSSDLDAFLDGRDTRAIATDWRAIDGVRGSASALVACTAQGVKPDFVADALAGRAGPLFDACLSPGASPPNTELSADELLGLTICRVLAGVDPQQAWSPRKVLTSVGKLPESCAAEVATEIRKNLTALRQIVTGDKEFEGFREGSRGLTSAKALLLVLLRPDLTRLLDWPRDETHADDATVALAAAWIGRLRGLRVEAQMLRHPHLDDATAAWACTVATDGPTPLRLPLTVSRDEGKVRMLLEGEVLFEGEDAVESALGIWMNLDKEKRRGIAERLAEALGVERRRTVLRTRGDVKVDVLDGGVRFTITGPAEVEEVIDDSVIDDALASHPQAAEMLHRILVDG